ncbi:MAG: beta/alpha barrel domain-containing protein [Armatimonadota bacterium]
MGIVDTVQELLGQEAEVLLTYEAREIPTAQLFLPGPDFVDRVLVPSDRSPAALRNLHTIFTHGRLSGTGYLSILPVDQGVEHSAGASFSINTRYFDPTAIVELAIEGGCNAVASMPGDHPIEWARYQVANGYLGRVPLINSGGPSGDNDFADVARTAIINKQAGGTGLITGRKAFQRPMDEEVRLLHLVQDIYLAPQITVA